MSKSGPLSLRPIIAKDQVRLSAARGFRLAMSGMSYRMFRSTVTIAILSLATAFMVHMLSYGLLQHATERGALSELLSERRLGQELTHLGDVDTEVAILDALAASVPEWTREYSRWSSLGNAQIIQAQATARRLREATRALDDFPVAARAVVIGDATAQEFFLSFEPGDFEPTRGTANSLGCPAAVGQVFRIEAASSRRTSAIANVRKGCPIRARKGNRRVKSIIPR